MTKIKIVNELDGINKEPIYIYLNIDVISTFFELLHTFLKKKKVLFATKYLGSDRLKRA